MSVESRIKSKIERTFTPAHLEIINESHKHIGHAGHDGSNDTHFKVVVVSDKFDGMGRIERQRIVNKELLSLFDEGLHALSLKLFTLEEYSCL